MRIHRENPDSEEMTRAAYENERYIFALKMAEKVQKLDGGSVCYCRDEDIDYIKEFVKNEQK
jgi:hypothetical protein